MKKKQKTKTRRLPPPPKTNPFNAKGLHWSLFFLSRFSVSFTRLSKHLSMCYTLPLAKGYCKYTTKALTLWKPLVMFSVGISNCLWFGGEWAPSFCSKCRRSPCFTKVSTLRICFWLLMSMTFSYNAWEIINLCFIHAFVSLCLSFMMHSISSKDWYSWNLNYKSNFMKPKI